MNITGDFNRSAESRLTGIFDRLSKVPEGEAVVTFLNMNNVKIDLQDDPVNWAASTLTITTVKNGIYHYKDPRIILKKGLSDDNLLQAIVHETGHLNQHLSRVGNPDRILSEEQYVLFYRAAEADAQALTTEVTYALLQQGDTGPWEATKFVGYGDIAKAYKDYVAANPGSESDGRARRVAFDAWFANPDRLAGYNAATVDHMIPFLKEGREKFFPNHGMAEKPLDDDWLKKLDDATTPPYLHLDGFRDVLTDTFYSGQTALRPPKNDANNNAPPPAPAPDGPAPINTPSFTPVDPAGGLSFWSP